MSIRELMDRKITVDNEQLAKGFFHAWIAVIASDDQIEPVELAVVDNFARVSKITEKFYSKEWADRVFREVLDHLNQKGIFGIFSAISQYFDNAMDSDKQLLLYSLIELACVDDNFSEDEMETVFQVMEALDVNRRDVLLAGMLFAARQSEKSC